MMFKKAVSRGWCKESRLKMCQIKFVCIDVELCYLVYNMETDAICSILASLIFLTRFVDGISSEQLLR